MRKDGSTSKRRATGRTDEEAETPAQQELRPPPTPTPVVFATEKANVPVSRSSGKPPEEPLSAPLAGGENAASPATASAVRRSRQRRAADGWQERFTAWIRTAGLSVNAPCPIHVRSPALLPITVCRILAATPGPVLVISSESASAEQLLHGIGIFAPLAGETRPRLAVPATGTPARHQWIPENEAARSAALDAAVRRTPAVFVATAAAALSPTLPPARFAAETTDLAVGSRDHSPEQLAERLTRMDYDNEIETHVPGEFSRRGGIIDLFSPLYEDPVRIEFFGNEIESIRFFHADTQLSHRQVDRIRIVPRGTIPATATETGATLLDYLPPDVPLILCRPAEIQAHLERFADPAVIRGWQQLLASAHPRICIETDADLGPTVVLPAAPLSPAETAEPVLSLDDVLGAHLSQLGRGTELWGWDRARQHLRRWHDAGLTLVAFCAAAGDAERLQQILAESADTRDIPLATHAAALETGLLLPEARLVFLSERELFGRHAPPRPVKSSPYRLENMLRDQAELEDGMYAVHAVYGICLYHGIKEIDSAGRLQEVLELEFAEDSRLYVPLDQIYLVSRYVGGTRKMPTLSKLGGATWKNAKTAAAAAALDIAADLLRLAAVREHAPGIAYSEDHAWEKLFAASFPYTETEDQAKAIQEVLVDMARPRPMDRLVCGDVGYGKTEVAVRAAFRAVLNQRQVAVLVPTTILAQQHYRTFRERMAEYPVRIEMLSRFRSRGEQNAIIQALNAGELDIVIGTHRLLQPDVRFRSLGLVVIDEEQRFGVEHKERLKQMRAEVDILTMTATPIPRTLYFSLAGLRNLSTILSPPVDRLPITTIVCQYEEPVIREALLRELDRKGQVFFLHNRVQSIDRFCDHLRRIVPEARYAVAHGQMHADDLETVMAAFIEGEVDVLVCTTIIESGLDIPNANTILIDHAERFGLAELYQLRGRVGRYHHQAYAYFLLPPAGALPSNARQRLAAIRRYTQLGVGFKLALRDLEIRGTGNLLGAEQSGHIAAVGFELYCDLLKQAVGRLSHVQGVRLPEIPITLDTVSVALHDKEDRLPAGIPPAYVGNESILLELYRRLRVLTRIEEIAGFAAELTDRFGALPDSVAALLELARIRVLALKAGIISVAVRDGQVLLDTTSGIWKNREKRVPRLYATDPLGQLCELCTLLEKMQPPAKA